MKSLDVMIAIKKFIAYPVPDFRKDEFLLLYHLSDRSTPICGGIYEAKLS